jgi:hypothetical protein
MSLRNVPVCLSICLSICLSVCLSALDTVRARMLPLGRLPCQCQSQRQRQRQYQYRWRQARAQRRPHTAETGSPRRWSTASLVRVLVHCKQAATAPGVGELRGVLFCAVLSYSNMLFSSVLPRTHHCTLRAAHKRGLGESCCPLPAARATSARLAQRSTQTQMQMQMQMQMQN